jgi:hypothetical protein
MKKYLLEQFDKYYNVNKYKSILTERIELTPSRKAMFEMYNKFLKEKEHNQKLK